MSEQPTAEDNAGEDALWERLAAELAQERNDEWWSE